ncbi:MAG: WD40 repeat domain-containing serine/threonine protein kinase [Verrucomicrobiota bacterium]
MPNISSAATALFAEVIELPEEEWDAFLMDANPGSDGADVRELVLAWLQEDAEAREIAESPLTETLGRIGDYQLESEIARGGMGVIYRARQVSLDRPVALKMIRESVLASADDIARFQAEAEAAANLSHPNLVPIHEVGLESGQHFFSMKLIEGGTLADPPQQLLEDHRAIAKCIATAARALQFAHQNGVLHRDLKPGNILLDEAGEPHITDFGLAKKLDATDGLTLSGQIVGTPAYMSPEQARGEKLTTASDVYSLGAILYFLLTSHEPFAGTNLIETLQLVAEEAPKPPRKINPSIPRDLETIVLTCLGKAPGDRYHSAEELERDLENWLSGEVISARPHTTTERIFKWARRKPALAALFVVSAMLGLALMVGGPLVAWREHQLSAEVARSAKDLRRELYFSEMNRAAQAWNEVAGLQHVEDLLENWRGEEAADLRGWEWQFLRNQCDRTLVSGRVLQEKLQGFRALDWSPDGAMFVAASEQGSALALYDSETGDFLRQLLLPPPPLEGVWQAKFSPDGLRVAARRQNSRFAVVHSLEDDEMNRFPTPDHLVADLDWSPNGQLLLVLGNAGTLQFFDVVSKKLVENNQIDRRIQDVSWESNGSRIAGVSRSREIFSWQRGRFSERIHVNPGRRTQSTAYPKIDRSNDGNWLAIAGVDQSIEIWNVNERALFREIPISGRVCFRLSPDSQSIAIGSGKAILTYSLETGQLEESFQGHADSVIDLSWSPDSSVLLSFSQDQSLRAWNRKTKTQSSRELGYLVGSQQNGPLFATSMHGYVRVWDASDVENGNLEIGLKGASIASMVDWSHDGKELLVTYRNPYEQNVPAIRIHSAASGDLLRQRQRQVSDIYPTHQLYARFSADGRYVASKRLQVGMPFQVWDHALEELIFEKFIPGHVTFDWSIDGRELFVRSEFKLTRISIPAGAIKEVAMEAGTVRDLAMHPAGRILAAAVDDRIELVDAATMEKTGGLNSFSGLVHYVRWSPDGRRLACAGHENAIQLVDAETWKQVCVLRLPGPVQINAIEWGDNGRQLLVGDTQGRIHFLNGGIRKNES